MQDAATVEPNPKARVNRQVRTVLRVAVIVDLDIQSLNDSELTLHRILDGAVLNDLVEVHRFGELDDIARMNANLIHELLLELFHFTHLPLARLSPSRTHLQ